MSMSILQMYNCSSNEELYQKLVSGSPEFKSLRDLIDKLKEKQSPVLKLCSPAEVGNFIKSNKFSFPRENEVSILFVNTKNCPVYSSVFEEERKEEIIKNAFKLGGTRAFLVSGSDQRENEMSEQISKIEKYLNNLGINGILDTFSVKEDSSLDSKRDSIFSEKGIVRESPNLNYLEVYYDNITPVAKDNKNIEEFVSYYTQKQLKDKNLKKDLEEIKELLKLENQDKKFEYFNMAKFDKDGDFLGIDNISSGGSDASLVPINKIALKLLEEKEKGLKNIIFFHNHPSGDPTPSSSDIGSSNQLEDVCNTLGMSSVLSIVVAKNGINEISPIAIFDPLDYEKIEEKEKRNYEQFFRERIREDVKNKKLSEKDADILYSNIERMASEMEEEYEKGIYIDPGKEIELYENISKSTLEDEKFKKNFTKATVGLVGSVAILNGIKTITLEDGKNGVLLEENKKDNSLLMFNGSEYIKAKEFSFNSDKNSYSWERCFSAKSIDELNFLDNYYFKGLVNAATMLELGSNIKNESLDRAYNIYLNKDNMNFVSNEYKNLVLDIENEKEEDRELNKNVLDFIRRETKEEKNIYDLDREKAIGNNIIQLSDPQKEDKELFLNIKTKTLFAYENAKYIGQKVYEEIPSLIKDLKTLSLGELHQKAKDSLFKENLRKKTTRKDMFMNM